MNIEKIKSDLAKLIGKGETIASTTYGSYDRRAHDVAFRTSGLSYLKNLLGPEHDYYTQFKAKTQSGTYLHTRVGVEILKALQSDLDDEWLFEFKSLVAAELFTDFLDMSEHLISEGYKDAAAVMIGSTLESHLKQLCDKHSIDITFTNAKEEVKPKKADVLNADLCKASVYNKLDQKQITAWLDLRNKAAHGDYSEYEMEQVQQMYTGVLSFITRVTL
ncbi:MAG: hypothetical protein QNK23_02090 [Crocinitomicaceae bacterium]|nr:hypothetical protein [Crocinitomicaceae bacterium]